MKKFNILLVVFLLPTLILLGCSNHAEKLNNVDMQQLTRVNVQTVKSDGSYDQEVIFSHKEDIEPLREIFEQIKWEQNVKAEMDRKEDVKATLFFEVDKNMPKKLVEYFIWFNQGDGTSTIIDRVEHAFGTLDKENTKKLKGSLN